MTTQIKGNATSTFGGNIDVTGNVVTDAPAFHAYNSGTQAISAGTLTKIIVNTEDFDTNNCYDTSNYRFTPNVAGYYQINASVYYQGSNNGFIILSKNGTRSWRLDAMQSGYGANSGSALLYLNGSTDYVELYAYDGGGATIGAGDSSLLYFDGHLVRAV